MPRLKDKAAIITGATSGIGLATARIFAREGAQLVLVDLDDTRGEFVTTEIVRAGGVATFVRADVSQPQANQRMIDVCLQHYGKLDILHCNADVTLAKQITASTDVKCASPAVVIRIWAALDVQKTGLANA